MYKKCFLYLVFVLFIGSSLSAQQMRSNVVLSDDYSFRDKWYKIPSQSIPIISDINKTYKHQKFYFLIYLGGFQVDNNSMAHVSHSVKALAPDGSQYFSFDSIYTITYEVPNPNIFLLCNSRLEISFEDEDSKGTYTISGDITDNLSKETIHFEKKIELIEFIEKEAFTNDSLYGEWMQNYFKSPKPEYALSNFMKFVANQKNNNVNLSNSFYIELFKTNNFLMNHLIDKYNDCSKSVQNDILKMYVYANIEDSLFLNSINSNQRKYIDSLRKEQNPYIIDIVNRPKQLDLLWAKFFASGSFEPIKKIVSTFKYAKYIGSLEKLGPVDDINKLNKDCWKELVFKASMWSVKANVNSYNLVRDYCKFLYLDDETSVEAKKVLSLILDEK